MDKPKFSHCSKAMIGGLHWQTVAGKPEIVTNALPSTSSCWWKH